MKKHKYLPTFYELGRVPFNSFADRTGGQTNFYFTPRNVFNSLQASMIYGRRRTLK